MLVDTELDDVDDFVEVRVDTGLLELELLGEIVDTELDDVDDFVEVLVDRWAA